MNQINKKTKYFASIVGVALGISLSFSQVHAFTAPNVASNGVSSNQVGNISGSNTVASLNKPSYFKSFNVSPTAINVKWNTVKGAESYQLKRDGVVVYEGSTTNFSNTSLSANTSYTFEVVAVNQSGVSKPAKLTVKTPNFSKPSTPYLKYSGKKTSSVTLKWSASKNADEYVLKRDGVEIYKGKDVSFTESGLQANTTYKFELVAVNHVGESKPTKLTIKTLNYGKPATPTKFKASDKTDSSFTLKWAEAKNAEEYILKKDGVEIYKGTDTTFSVTGLQAKTSYKFELVAVNQTRVSNKAKLTVKTAKASTTPDTPDTPTTPPPTTPPTTLETPDNFKTTAIDDTSISLKWDAVKDADEYIIERGSSIVYRGKNTSFTEKALQSNSYHTFVLTAVNGSVKSKPVTITVSTEKAYTRPTEFLLSNTYMGRTMYDMGETAEIITVVQHPKTKQPLSGAKIKIYIQKPFGDSIELPEVVSTSNPLTKSYLPTSTSFHKGYYTAYVMIKHPNYFIDTNYATFFIKD